MKDGGKNHAPFEAVSRTEDNLLSNEEDPCVL
jgi:hypothetical protein